MLNNVKLSLYNLCIIYLHFLYICHSLPGKDVNNTGEVEWKLTVMLEAVVCEFMFPTLLAIKLVRINEVDPRVRF